MRRFNFKLQSLLKVRIMQMEEAQQRYSQALCEYLQEEKVLNNLKSELEISIKLQQAEQQLSTLNIPVLISYSNFNKILENNILDQQNKVLLAWQKKDECLKLLEAAVKKKKVVEKLKEKSYEQYLHDFFKEEQNLLDEIAGR